ncbi:MAG: YbaB/EbfC family nucleoid-associated protein [Actinocatenispora sp.]
MPGGGQPNLQQLLKQAQKMQEQLASAQEELANTEVKGSSGGGLVTATVTGSTELKSIEIDPKVVDPDDVETLQDLIVAAVHSATEEARKIQQDKMGPIAGGLGGMAGGMPGGLPGLGM